MITVARMTAAALLVLLGVASAASAEPRAAGPLGLEREAASVSVADSYPNDPLAPSFRTSWAPLAMAGASSAQEEAAPSRGSSRRALIYSLLLPGMGEWSLGERGRAKAFFITEGAIWTHFVWFQVAGKIRKDDYIEQAQRNAGVGIDDADDEYWRILGQYATSQGSGADAYEEALRREARDLYPDSPADQDAWVADRLPSGERAWSWSSPELQTAYRETRERSRRAFDRSKYSIAAAIVNRIASVIDTQIVRRKVARREAARSDAGTRLHAEMAPDGSGRIYLTRAF